MHSKLSRSRALFSPSIDPLHKSIFCATYLEKKKMGWNYPHISLEEIVRLVKGFIDILILASGYQSSGLLAHWDVHNIKKAFQWGSFFENVLRHMNSSEVYHDSIEELDAALHDLTFHPSFPKGLSNISCSTLYQARSFALAHFFHTLPLRDSHLRVFLTAIIEMDLDKPSESEHDCFSVYLNKLTLQNKLINSVSDKRDCTKDSVITSEHIVQTTKIENCTDDDLMKFTLQELFKRQSAVSCILAIETGLDVLSNAIGGGSWTESEGSLKLQYDRAEEHLVDFVMWNHWKSKNLSYFLDKRTIRLVSGASMIFSAPKIQWVQVFERLNSSSKSNVEDLLETIELFLLGCVARKWEHILKYFSSISYNSCTISKLYHEVCNLLPGRSQSFHSNEEETILRCSESGILEHLAELLNGRLHTLWKLPPILAAVAIPFWSPLFRTYLGDIETQFKANLSTIRCCSCIEERKDHKDCQLAERLWCLYIFQVSGSQIIYGANDADV